MCFPPPSFYFILSSHRNPTWWKRRSGLERGLTVIAVSGFLLCIALAVALGILASNRTCNTASRPGKSTYFHSEPQCNTDRSCMHIASAMLFEKRENKTRSPFPSRFVFPRGTRICGLNYHEFLLSRN